MSTFFLSLQSHSIMVLMLKKISKISLSLACMIILLHAIIPHHHHPDKPICFHQINHHNCDNHENCCDFGNEENHHHDFDKGKCIIDELFAPKNDHEIETYVRLSVQDILVNLDLFFSLACDFILDDEGEIFRRNNLTFNYKNPLAISNVGLRAPPRLMHNS